MFPCEAIVRLSCVVYLLTMEKAESSFGASPAGVEYIRAVSLCSPLFRFVFLYFVSPCVLPCVSLCVPFCVSLVCLVLRAVHAYRRGVSSCVPFSLLICGARYDFHTGRRFVLLAACRLVLRLVRACRFRLALRIDMRSYPVCRSCVSSCVLLLRAVPCRAFPSLRSDMRVVLYPACRLARR